MGIKVFNCFGLVGQDERDLSAVSKTSLDDNRHKAMVIENDRPLLFEWSYASEAPTNTTQHPYSVRPNDYDGAGVWEEKTTVLYGTVDPPDPAGLPDGTIYYLYE